MSAADRLDLRRCESLGNEIANERDRAHAKHADKPGGSMEMKDWTEPDWVDVLVEEVGEVSRARCDYRHGLMDAATYRAELRKELIQVAAMATAWVAAIDDA